MAQSAPVLRTVTRRRPGGEGEGVGGVVLAGGAVVLAVAVGEVDGLEELAVEEAFETGALGGDGLDVDLEGAAPGEIDEEGGCGACPGGSR